MGLSKRGEAVVSPLVIKPPPLALYPPVGEERPEDHRVGRLHVLPVVFLLGDGPHRDQHHLLGLGSRHSSSSWLLRGRLGVVYGHDQGNQ
jgi:hypothetical protein